MGLGLETVGHSSRVFGVLRGVKDGGENHRLPGERILVAAGASGTPRRLVEPLGAWAGMAGDGRWPRIERGAGPQGQPAGRFLLEVRGEPGVPVARLVLGLLASGVLPPGALEGRAGAGESVPCRVCWLREAQALAAGHACGRPWAVPKWQVQEWQVRERRMRAGLVGLVGRWAGALEVPGQRDRDFPRWARAPASAPCWRIPMPWVLVRPGLEQGQLAREQGRLGRKWKQECPSLELELLELAARLRFRVLASAGAGRKC